MSKPNLGDTIINRYTLVTRLRTVDGLQAWKASDRVLARDCQLFLVNDKSSLPHVNSIASSLALSRNTHFTRVLQLHHAGPVAVIVTALDSGLSLTDYLQGPAGHTLSYEAIRTIIGECARAQQQLLVDGITHESVSTDTIRIALTGVQITDAPISPLLSEMSGAPSGLPREQLATRQLAAVLYSLLMRTPSSVNPSFDINALDVQTPSELRLICARGLGIDDPQQGSRHTVPMASLSELTALLGSWTPMESLNGTDIAVPGIDGDNSIINVHIRQVDPPNLVPVPDDIVASSPLAAMPSSIFPMSQTATFPKIPPRSVESSGAETATGTESTPPAAGTGYGPATSPIQPALPSETASTTSWRSLWGKGRSMLSGGDVDDRQKAPTPAPSTPTPDPRFHDIAAAEMADILAPTDAETGGSLFPTLETPQNGHSQTASTVNFDFSTKPLPAPVPHARPHDTDFSYHPRTESTGSIPIFGEDGSLVLPGQESARSLLAEKQAKEKAGAAGLPPSFVPKSQQGEAANPDEPDLADTPLLSRFTTKVIAVFVIAAIVAVALAFALREFMGSSQGGVSSSASGPWPEMNLNDVPFGDQTATSSQGSSSASSSASASSSSSSASSSSSSSSSSATEKKKSTVIHLDKTVSAVPTPAVPQNNTPFDIDKQEFLTNPANQQGYGYYMHLSFEQTVYRFVITIRSSGGTGYLLAKTTDDPTQGTQVAKFTFDTSGTTDVKLTKPIKAQDFMLWVPIDSLPNNQLYINSVKLY